MEGGTGKQTKYVNIQACCFLQLLTGAEKSGWSHEELAEPQPFAAGPPPHRPAGLWAAAAAA